MAHRPRIGEYRFIDDESGFSYPSGVLAKRWDGAIVARENDEIRQPQMDVRGLRDPAALTDVRPREEQAPYCPVPFLYRGGKWVPVYTGPMSPFEPYIADTSAASFGMTVACTLVVYP